MDERHAADKEAQGQINEQLLAATKDLEDKFDAVDGQVKEVANEADALGKIVETAEELLETQGDHIQNLDQVASGLGFGLGLGLELGLGLLQAKQHPTLSLPLPLPYVYPYPYTTRTLTLTLGLSLTLTVTVLILTRPGAEAAGAEHRGQRGAAPAGRLGEGSGES